MSAIATEQFQLVKEKGWRRGLGNLLQGEYSAWFKSSKWWKHLAMWFSIINLMMVVLVLTSTKIAQEGGEMPEPIFMYGIFGGMFVAFGVMVIMQRVLIGEKHAGTAAWVLSKPVTRTSFVVSRLIVNSIVILLTSVIVPGVIFYITLGFSATGWLSPLGFFAGLLMVALHTFFWITFVWMMGTLFESSAMAIGIPMALYFILWMGSGTFPWLVYVSPLLLSFSPAPEQMNALSVSFMIGEPVFSWIPLIVTAAYCIVFIAVAILRFNRQEF